MVDAGSACGDGDVRGFDLAAARYCASSDTAGPATCAHVGADAGAGAWAGAGRTGGEGGGAGAKAGGEDGVTDGMLHVSSTIDTM